MDRRLKLQTILEDLLGSRHVYFQPPESIKLVYPCIIYNLTAGNTKYADDKPYVYERHYEITLIYTDPDTDLIDKLAYSLSSISHDRHFATENLYHDVFTVYY